MPVFKKVNKNFFKKWTHKMAYVAGFFSADGYITINKRGGQFWCIEIKDEELLREIKKTLKSDHMISVRAGKENGNLLYRLQIGSIEMCGDLRKLGFAERKTKSLAVPNVPKEYFSSFVRGYFDGDGNVWIGSPNQRRRPSTLKILTVFTSCSLEFLKQLHDELRIIGINGGSIYVSRLGYCRLQFSVLDSLKLYDFMYNGLGTSKLFLKRKKDVFEKYVNMRL